MSLLRLRWGALVRRRSLCEQADMISGVEDDHYPVEGIEIGVAEARHPLAASLVRCINNYGGREIALNGIRRLNASIEAVLITMKTGAPQAPAYDIRHEERLAVLFEEGAAPAVVPLRREFPRAPHSYGLPMEVPLSAPMVMCIDDRPWGDAISDYTGSEILRRISSWFRRAGNGEMNDDLQFVDPAFLPSPQTISMPGDLFEKMVSSQSEPIFIALTSSLTDAKILLAKEYNEAKPPTSSGHEWVPYVSMSIGVSVTEKSGMYRPPSRLGHLRQSLQGSSPDLLEQLREHIQKLIHGTTEENRRRLYDTRLIINILIDHEAAGRIESMCLIPEATIGKMGVAFGLLNSPMAEVEGYTISLIKGEVEEASLDEIQLVGANLCHAFDRVVAPQWAGRPALSGQAVALGAGAIGSNVLNHLVREGAFSSLCIIDDDHLRPHNLARHLLRSDRIGHPKASAVADELKCTRPDLEVSCIETKFGTSLSAEVDAVLADSDAIVDLTASVGASRQLSDQADRGRAACAFFNPTGDAVVVMVEDRGRDCDLATLEACYYSEIIRRDALRTHLRPSNQAVVSSGQCRATTSRIPSSDAAILSGLAARALSEGFQADGSSLSIRTLQRDGSVSAADGQLCEGVISRKIDGWWVRIPSSTATHLQELRGNAAPNETGGVLLGIVDHSRRRIEVVVGLPAPTDSVGTPTHFERGVRRLREQIEDVAGVS